MPTPEQILAKLYELRKEYDDDREDQRAPEDVVTREVAADDQRIDQRDQRNREECRDDGAEPGP